MVITQSLLSDGDIKIDNNYRQNDYLPYWAGVLRPHFSSPSVTGELYSVHAPGLPAIIAPAFRTAGYWGVVVWIAVLVAIGSSFVWQAGYIVTGDPSAAWFAWGAVTLTVPVILHGTLVYPDHVAGTLLAGGTLALVAMNQRTRESGAPPQHGGDRTVQWTLARSFWLGAAVGSLPWLHTRLALPGAILGFVLLLRLKASLGAKVAKWHDFAAFAVPIVASATGWFAFFWITYGTFNPSAPYGDRIPLGMSHVAIGLLGLTADQEFGLLLNGPVHVLWISGFWSIFRRDSRLALELALIVGPYVIASSAYPMWYAGASPPARFLVPVIFPLGVAFAMLWAKQDRRSRAMSLALLGLSMLVAATLAFGRDGALAYNPGQGRALWLDWIAPLVDLPRALPSFFRAGATLSPRAAALGIHLVNPAILWSLALLVGWGLFRLLGRSLPDTTPARVLLAPCCLLIVFGLGVSTNWNLAGGVHITATRSQLGLLRADELRVQPFGVQYQPARIFHATLARTLLSLTTSRIDRAPPEALLFLTEVPAGDYFLRVERQAPARSELFLGIGRATGVAWHWSLADGQLTTAIFHLPVPASSIVVNGDEEAVRLAERVALVPTEQSQSQPHGGNNVRARDAVRYGQVVAFVTDERVILDLDGFWVLGGRRPEVIIATDNLVNALDVEVRNVGIANRVGIRAGRWTTERRLAPDELWRVRVPVLGLGPSFALQFEVEAGVPTDRGVLGCHVVLR